MKTTRTMLSILLLGGGAALLAMIVSNILGNTNVVGNLLWTSYSWCAFVIPVLFFWLFWIVSTGPPYAVRTIWPLLLLVPFFTTSLGLRIFLWNSSMSPPPLWELSSLFGQNGTAIFWFVMSSVSILGISLFYIINSTTKSPTRNGSKKITRGSNISHIVNNLQQGYNKMANSIKEYTSLNPTRVAANMPTTSPPQYNQNNTETYTSTPKYDRSHYDGETVPTNSSSHNINVSPSPQQQPSPNTTVTTTSTSTESSPNEPLTVSSPQNIPQQDSYTLIFNKRNKYSIPVPDQANHYGETQNNSNSTVYDTYATDDVLQDYDEYDDIDTTQASHTELAVLPRVEDIDNYFDSDTYDPSQHDNENNNHYEYNDDAMSEYQDSGEYDNEHNEINKDNVNIDDSFFSDDVDHLLKRNEEYIGESETLPDRVYGDDTFGTTKGTSTEKDGHTLIMQKKKYQEETTSPTLIEKKVRRGKYRIPIDKILDPPAFGTTVDPAYDEKIGKILEITLREFNIDAKVTSICRGPVVTMFEILPAPGVRLRRIVELGDNIALRLAAPSIRIVAPIPGKEAVGIEVPNKQRDTVAFSELVSHTQFRKKDIILPIVLGKDISAGIHVIDLSKTPHMLIAGATGSGKSVCVNSIICSLLYRCSPEEVRLLLIDPKIVELSFYNDIPHLLVPVISDLEKSLQALRWSVGEMERRYQLLETQNVREIQSYNKKLQAKSIDPSKRLPYMVIVIDEFADLMMTGGKEMEILVSRIAAKSRAVGIHLIIATQRPSTDVITGIIKSNIPTRIAFMVASKIDSRIILDTNGAEKLLGRGDMLYSSASTPFPVRLQGAYLSEEEVERVVAYVKLEGGEPSYIGEEIFSKNSSDSNDDFSSEEDPLWDDVINEVQTAKKASASHLQRRFKIGYNRAARLIDDMEYHGIIGPQQGSKAREVYV